ncbi:MAG TPA: hypothetical protein VFV15_06535 [Moraxellaceae bacterium]|nr:hypothetical protein [Moraxellaceae bacterium]
MAEYLAENSRLRLLSRRYSEGQISFEDYRAARREILVALESGEVQASAAPLNPEPEPATATAPAAPAIPDDETVFLKTMPPQVPVNGAATVAAPEAPTGWDAHTRVLAVVLAVAFVLALGALFYVFAL